MQPAAWITEQVRPVPRNIYGATKTAAEDLCELVWRDHGMPCLILRTSRFFPEPDDRDDAREAFGDLNLKVNELLYRRVDIEDAVQAHVLALQRAPEIGFGRYIISATTPFAEADLSELRRDPPAVVARLVPEYAARLRAARLADAAVDRSCLRQRAGARAARLGASLRLPLRAGATPCRRGSAQRARDDGRGQGLPRRADRRVHDAEYLSHLPMSEQTTHRLTPVDEIRAQFPGLSAPHAQLDGAAGTQVPEPVIEAVAEAMRDAMANVGGAFSASRSSTEVVVNARKALADLLGGVPDGVVLGPNMTTLTFHFADALSRTWTAGDEIVVTSLDHDANVRPWRLAAERVGVTVRVAEFDVESGELPVEAVESVIGERTKLVAVTAASNAIGTRPDVAAISACAHAARRADVHRRRACDPARRGRRR